MGTAAKELRGRQDEFSRTLEGNTPSYRPEMGDLDQMGQNPTKSCLKFEIFFAPYPFPAASASSHFNLFQPIQASIHPPRPPFRTLLPRCPGPPVLRSLSEGGWTALPHRKRHNLNIRHARSSPIVDGVVAPPELSCPASQKKPRCPQCHPCDIAKPIEIILTETNNKLFRARRFPMKTQKLILAVLLTGLVWSAQAADVAGKWVGEFDSQIGHQKYTFKFENTGDKLKAEAEAESDQGKRHVDFIDVKLSGDTLTFAENRQIQDNTVRIDYTGKVEADKIQFTRKVGDFGSTEFPAKREGAGTAETKTAAADSKDISGVWHGEFDSQIGMQKYDYTLKVSDGKVTGKANSEINDQKRETELTEGKISGDTVTFVEPLKFNDTDVRIEYTDKIKGDEIAFHRKVGDFATEDFVAKRKAATATETPTH